MLKCFIGYTMDIDARWWPEWKNEGDFFSKELEK
jgi:hypothetical protein